MVPPLQQLPVGGWYDASEAQLASAGGRAIDPAASAAVRGALLRSVRSVCMALVGDSTGDNLDQPNGSVPMDDFFNILGKTIGTANPTWSVWNRQWNVTTEVYDPPTQLQAGTGNGGGDRYANLVSGTLQYLAASAPNGDMEVVARVLPNDGWAPGGATTLRTIIARYSASGSNRGWYLALDQAGNLSFTMGVTAGTSDAWTALSTTAVPFANGVPGWVRVVFDADNGASGADTKFYTSSDGSNWTQLGATVTNAGAVTQQVTFLTYYLGSHSTTPTAKFNGRIYWVEVKQGLPGASQTGQVPPMPDWWDQATTPGAGVLWGGAPVLLLLNGSASGQNIAYFNDTTRRLKLHAPHAQRLLFLNDGHNEGTPTEYAWNTLLTNSGTGWLADVRNRVTCPIVFMSQNPSLAGTQRVDQQTADWNTARGVVGLAAVSKFSGMYPLDTWPAFTDLSTDLSPDHLHPTQQGATKWGTYIYQQMFA